MVIEYAGELIRSTLTDQRERYYNSRGIGCYMFKIDENFVVDATMKGNAARFINHACEVRKNKDKTYKLKNKNKNGTDRKTIKCLKLDHILSFLLLINQS